jgi:hypothetical protein
MDYSKDYISEMMQWIDPYSILVIEGERNLKRIYCPFRVIVVVPVGGLNAGDIALVQAAKVTLGLQDVYIIEGKAYYVIHFRVLG